ncbi:phosphoribosyltransferase family protein [Methylomicrobium sp. RS1]|uniref:phosphoribosyltransferase family protein n=1 Tax=Candidatus Methylomicrobium oryzae TaxID=2802053 RepID=UPI001923096E|nr:phosphoribosyltransferase family protein [Methylomicrobium sp. RS1]MBL1264140.1 hypothetical protein [Methylomicrobium sp. RS1]
MLTFDDIVLKILAISTIFSIAAWTGFLPRRITRYFIRNRAEETLQVLSSLGITPDKYLKENLAKSVPSFVDSKEIENSLNKLLAKCSIKKEVGVGKIHQVKVKNYVDVMAMSTDAKNAEQLARHLTSYWRKLLNDNNVTVQNPKFDLVVTPKSGAPILGYEFAKILNVPFALHTSDHEKFTSQDPKLYFQSVFDSFSIPSEGSVALVVDDSATGGRKVLEAVSALRKCGIIVTDCLVLFEPTIKEVRRKLIEQGVSLHSIVKR